MWEDNEATQKILASGKIEKALAHCSRTHDLYLAWSSDQLKAGGYRLMDCNTKAMCADIFTKYFVCPLAWQHALNLLSIFAAVKCVYKRAYEPTAPSKGTKGSGGKGGSGRGTPVGGAAHFPTNPQPKSRVLAKWGEAQPLR